MMKEAGGGDRRGDTASSGGQSAFTKDGAVVEENGAGVTGSHSALDLSAGDEHVAYTDRQSATGTVPTTEHTIAALDAVTIGEALEAAAVGSGDKPVDESDVRAIRSAEALATGASVPSKNGIGASAHTAAQFNIQADAGGNVTLADVLTDATADLHADKVVTYEDALEVIQAELQGKNGEDLKPGGVGASLVAAANLNEKTGWTSPPNLEEEDDELGSRNMPEDEHPQKVVPAEEVRQQQHDFPAL